MKKTIKLFLALLAILFSSVSFSQKLPSIGFNAGYMREYIRLQNPIAYEEEIDSTSGSLLLKSAFNDYNIGVVCDERLYCYQIIISIKNEKGLDKFIKEFDSNWIRHKDDSWFDIDYKYNIKSNARIRSMNDKIIIQITGENYYSLK